MQPRKKPPPPPPRRRRPPKVAESMLEELWFGEDDSDRARRQAGESVAAAMVLTTGLKPFPVFAARALALLANPDFEVRAVRQLIERDQNIAAKVFRTARSAAFRPKAPLAHIGDVINRLGSREIQAVIASVACMELFGDETGLGAKVRDHAAATGALARTLARGRPNATDAFLCGLMHDIGKQMILQTEAPPYVGEHEGVLDAPDAAHVVEREALGYDHALLGAFVLGEWGFGDPITTTVAIHHQPMRARAAGPIVAELVAFVRLADRIEYVLRSYQGGEARACCEQLATDPSAEQLGMDAQHLESEWTELVKARQEMRSAR